MDEPRRLEENEEREREVERRAQDWTPPAEGGRADRIEQKPEPDAENIVPVKESPGTL